ncbi:2-dehydropantoate 2-reductase [Vibrio sinaloensis]|uniref:2-dehydropantoate 2-reductase n=1 Tax=Photobacterium sp. (strain ATCC 43367) TaxID=379097 RepID=UPI00057DB1D1|nr:2-dehydropantoate 2-reductase [Vibrio sinaloensis]KHT45356.1 2-dehydropantoate 2-reductase [Vibrio sinaloensis]
MNIVVLGPGAIGSLWAYSLHQAGHTVALYSKQEYDKLPLQLDGNTPITLANNQPVSLQNADVLLVTVKAPQVIPALEVLRSDLHPDCIVVLMHNGMGTAEIVASRLPNNPLVLATTTHGALRQSHHQVLHTGQGSTQLGGYNSKGNQCDFLQQVFAHALPDVYWNENILDALWLKLAINCAINPLTAIHQVKNGQLADEAFKPTLHQLLDEVHQVMTCEGLTLSRNELDTQVYNVIQATAENRSSMHQDICHHRPSEIDFITGYLIQKAHDHQLDVPSNEALYQQIKRIEKSWTS